MFDVDVKGLDFSRTSCLFVIDLLTLFIVFVKNCLISMLSKAIGISLFCF